MRFLIPLLFLPLPAVAQTGCTGNLAFGCDIKSKVLEVCVMDGTTTYAFGPVGSPELELSVPVTQAEYVPWAGVGRSIHESVTFRNGPYAYEVWVSLDRQILDDTNPKKQTGGVIVSKGGREVAALACTPFTISNDIESLWMAKEEAGQCWNRDAFAWGACVN